MYVGSRLLSQQLLADRNNFAPQSGIEMNCAINFFASMKYCAMVTPSEKLTNFEERCLGLLTNQIHSDLARHHDILIALFAAHGIERDMIIFGHRFGDLPATQMGFSRIVA